VEGFAQIVMYGKSLQGGGGYANGKNGKQEGGGNCAFLSLQDDARDPSVHPWGGLAATRDSMLTVLDCFLDGKPLEVLQNVFESARARERERELLYPDACGGGGRGWICQNTSLNGRGHGLKESCALHTARLSCEALVDFWSALGDETRHSLLRMKEEDFVERLMFRFDSKRFCRDCRRNVLREFKEMKELKRSRKEPQCTPWFCAADTVFRYEVSDSEVQVDWRDCFAGEIGSVYQRFEWALGTTEGKSDLLAFEDVGLMEYVRAINVDLVNVSACFITVRGWKRDGRCTELCAKAHALNGQLCVHRRLIVGDGFVSITKGESIQRFFERAEETEEEEDEESVDKDGNEIEGEASRPQKHAKSPELARDFLLDTATVIFKEQVEKAFREGTARQNAHSSFVCLSLGLLEERVRVACKEISTLEKQNKLLEEEEDEKREEEERRERRKLKEKEKKLRRKEKLKSKEKGNKVNSKTTESDSNGCLDEPLLGNEEERESSSGSQVDGYGGNNSEDSMSRRPSSPDMAEARPSADAYDSENGDPKKHEQHFIPAYDIEDSLSLRDGNGAFIVEQSKSMKRRTQSRKWQQHPDAMSWRSSPVMDAPRNVARVVAPAPSYEEKRTTTTTHVIPKNGITKTGLAKGDSEGVSKFRIESWNQTHPHSNTQDIRHEENQSCACGSSKKVSGMCDSSSGSMNGIVERVPFEDSQTKLFPRGRHLDSRSLQHAGETPPGRPRSAPGHHHDGEDKRYLQARSPSETTENSKHVVYSRTSSLDTVLSSRSDAASQVTCDSVSNNRTVLHMGNASAEVAPSRPLVGRPMWAPHTTNGMTSGKPLVGKGLPISSGNHGPAENGSGNSDMLHGGRLRPSTPVSQTSTLSSPLTASVNSVELSPVFRLPSSSDGSRQVNQIELDSKVPKKILGTQNLADEGHETTLVHIVVNGNKMGNSSGSVLNSTTLPQSTTSTPTCPAAPGGSSSQSSSISTAVVSESCPVSEVKSCGVVANVAGTLEDGELLPPKVPRPERQAWVALGMSSKGPLQAPHAEHVMLHTSPPPLGLGPPPRMHLHSNGHSALSFPPGAGPPRPPPKNVYAFPDMVPLQGPAQYPMQVHGMMSSATTHLPSQPQSFGYYHQVTAPWTPPCSRNGVLPLPQPAGGFLSPGHGTGPLNLSSMGTFPSMSLPVPGPLEAAPLGVRDQQFPLMSNGIYPNGMNLNGMNPNRLHPIQIQDSRYGGGTAAVREMMDGQGSVPRILDLSAEATANGGCTEDHHHHHHMPAQQLVSNGMTQPSLVHTKDMSIQPPPELVLRSDISGFSLFHSGWPTSAAEKTSAVIPSANEKSMLVECVPESFSDKSWCNGRLKHEQAADAATKPSLPALGEYSLFNPPPNNGFRFFGAHKVRSLVPENA